MPTWSPPIKKKNIQKTATKNPIEKKTSSHLILAVWFCFSVSFRVTVTSPEKKKKSEPFFNLRLSPK